MDLKTQTVRARIEPELKAAAEAIFAEVGLRPTDAIRLFYRQVANQGAIPIDLRQPNAESRAAIEELRSGGGNVYHTMEEFRKSLDLD